MQVFSAISTRSTSEGVSTDTGNENPSAAGSFADALGATLEQSGQAQQTTVTTQSGAVSSQEEQPSQPETNEAQGLAVDKDVVATSGEAASTANLNTEETNLETVGEIVDLLAGTGKTIVDSDEELTVELGLEELEPEEEDTQDAAAEPEPEMVYLSPFFFNQLNLNQPTEKTADSTIKIASGESSGEYVPAVTDGAVSAVPVTSVNQSGNEEVNTAMTQAEFNLSTAAADVAVVPQNDVAVILPQGQTEVKLPQREGTRRTDEPIGQTGTVNFAEQSEGENLISRITQALLQQDGSMTADTGGEASEEVILTQGTDDMVQTGEISEELPVSLSTTTFAVQVEDGAQGKTEAVNEIIDRFTQDFKGAESCPGEINITLTPEDLGELKISVHMTDSGGVTAHITTKDKDICALISSQIGRLIECMESKGVAVEDVNVVYDELGNNQNSGQGFYQEQRDQQENSRYAAATEVTADSEDTAAAAPIQFVNTKVISTGNSLSY